MAASKAQQELLKAVREDNLGLVKLLLQQGVDPNFFAARGITPLREAIRNDNLKMVRALVQGGADVNLAKPNMLMPLDHAQDMADVTNRQDIAHYLLRKGAKCRDDMPPPAPAQKAEAPPVRKEPEFTASNLKDVFNPQSWVGKIAEMKETWERVPTKLKRDFDFETRLADARRQSLKNKAMPPKPPSAG